MSDNFNHLPLNQIEVVSNTRTEFEEPALKELAVSIKHNGVLTPILVKPIDNGKFRLIAGERRYRASLLAGKADIPARIMDIPDHKILAAQIVENLQRKNVSTMDEVNAIVRLQTEEGLTLEEISKAIGKATSHVSMQILISKAVPELHDALKNLQMSRAVALHIAKLDSPEKQKDTVAALKRDKAAFWVKAKDAEIFINNRYGVAPKKEKTGRFAPKKETSENRFYKDWKYYFVRFSAEQFEQWQAIVRNRQEIEVWMEGVEAVMLLAQGGQSDAGN